MLRVAPIIDARLVEQVAALEREGVIPELFLTNNAITSCHREHQKLIETRAEAKNAYRMPQH